MEQTEHSIKVTERLLPSEDFSYKKTSLRKHLEQIEGCDSDFFSLTNKIFIDEGQKGEIVDEMISKTSKLRVWNTNLLLDVHSKIGQIVNRFDEQVEEMKKQQITITYKEGI